MTPEKVFYRADANPVEMLPGVTRHTLSVTDEIMIVEMHLKAGAEIPTHSHPNHQGEYLVSGELVLTVEDREYTFKAGDTWAIPGGIEHSAKFVSDCVLIGYFTPAREDYMD